MRYLIDIGEKIYCQWCINERIADETDRQRYGAAFSAWRRARVIFASSCDSKLPQPYALSGLVTLQTYGNSEVIRSTTDFELEVILL